MRPRQRRESGEKGFWHILSMAAQLGLGPDTAYTRFRQGERLPRSHMPHLRAQNSDSSQSCSHPSPDRQLAAPKIALDCSSTTRTPIAGSLCHCRHAPLSTSWFQFCFSRFVAAKRSLRVRRPVCQVCFADLRLPMRTLFRSECMTFGPRSLKRR